MYEIDCSDPVFSVIHIQDTTVYYPDYVNDYLDSYIRYCRSLQIPKEDADDIFQTLSEFRKAIVACLLENNCGQRHNARDFFDDALKRLPINSLCVSLTQSRYYRARLAKSVEAIGCNTKYAISEMFHIPFELRYKVSDQRFSYPGLPCLYFGESVEVCCAELDCWNDDLNVAEYKANLSAPCNVFDLYFFESYCFDSLTHSQFKQFLLLWPLVACCSFRFSNSKEMRYRQDYIIPQFLLEIIIDKNALKTITGNNSQIFGIRYHSVKTSLFEANPALMTSSYVNYVFPAQKIARSGYCPTLSGMFTGTGVYYLSEIYNGTSH